MLEVIRFSDEEIKIFLSKLDYRFQKINGYYPPYAASDKIGRTEEKTLALKCDEQVPREYLTTIHRDTYIKDKEIENHLMARVFQKEIKNKLLGI